MLRYKKTPTRIAAVLALMAFSACASDAMRGPALKDVRLGGYPGAKLNDLVRERYTSAFAQKEIFGEARQAFVDRDDDFLGHGGYWRGEFWGKLMLGAARLADYLQDPAFTRFVKDECHRLMATQDADGYIGSYADKALVSPDGETKKIYNWLPVWNIWNRKYAMWGMLMAYKTTGDKAILASVTRQMDQLMSMLKEKGLRLHDTGCGGMNGLPSMSILKPLVMLYEETGDRRYLDYAAEMLSDWDRADGMAPNFFRNAKKDQPLHTWYPTPEKWAKSYEFMSCVDGLLEYYRVTGDRRCLETAQAIRDNLAATEANPLGSVGYGDKFVGATKCVNALNEICDVIHWIRLNVDLFLITGDEKHLDSIETAYFNAYLAGIWRGGRSGPFFVRGNCRNHGQGQCGMAHQNCCVNNLPRTFMDMASTVVTRDAAGAYHVNFYADATAELDGVRFEISGNYPVGNVVTVKGERVKGERVKGERVKGERVKGMEVRFHKPAWCKDMKVSGGDGLWTIVFDMNPRLVERVCAADPRNAKSEDNWICKRYREYWSPDVNRDLQAAYRTTDAAQVMWGPLVLTKTRLLPETPRALVRDESSVVGKGYSVKVTPMKPEADVWGQWRVELTKPGAPTISVRAADYASGTDLPVCENADLFSIWF